MKYLIRITVLWVAVCAAFAASAEIVLTFVNGEIVTLSTEDMPVMTIGDGQLVVKGRTVNMSYPLDGLKNYRFGASGEIETASDIKASIRVAGNLITVTTESDDFCVRLYNPAGVEVMAQPSREKTCVVDISPLAAGVYILSANGISTKITKQ